MPSVDSGYAEDHVTDSEEGHGRLGLSGHWEHCRANALAVALALSAQTVLQALLRGVGWLYVAWLGSSLADCNCSCTNFTEMSASCKGVVVAAAALAVQVASW